MDDVKVSVDEDMFVYESLDGSWFRVQRIGDEFEPDGSGAVFLPADVARSLGEWLIATTLVKAEDRSML
jgi:hypothetical protein